MAYAARWPSSTRSAAVVAASAAALAPLQVPSPIDVIVSMAKRPSSARMVAAGRDGSPP